MDRDVRDQRRAGRAELDAHCTAEAVTDERHLGRIDHRVLEERIPAGLRARAHQRAVVGVDRGLRCHFRNVLRQHALAVAEDVGRERDVAELGPGLGELLRFRRHALARMDHEHGRAPAGHFVIVGHIGFELGVSVAVLDPLVLHLGLRRA